MGTINNKTTIHLFPPAIPGQKLYIMCGLNQFKYQLLELFTRARDPRSSLGDAAATSTLSRQAAADFFS